jgi:23S rRNA (cytidine1920-2'-O)/16S rRNA (cytidine1409-2'-O)-methyltransferase
MSSAKSVRLDLMLVVRGLASSRTQAKSLIEQGLVKVAGSPALKASQTVSAEELLEVVEQPRYVSRGGLKLEAAISGFSLHFAGAVVLDVGASTGGFTDCALQHGAARVICLDVGTGQLHDRLLRDPRVVNLEQLNVRDLRTVKLPEQDFDRIVIDVSFISLRLVLPVVWPLLRPGGHLMALVKPQFEAGRQEVSRGRGVIRDDGVRLQVLREMRQFAAESLAGAIDGGALESPISGGDGNREFLWLLSR